MSAFNPPREINGIPLSERTRWLLFAPIGLLMNPKKFLGGQAFLHSINSRWPYDDDTEAMANPPPATRPWYFPALSSAKALVAKP
jgi:hypothetical protein